MTAFTGATAVTGLGAERADAATSDKSPPNTYVPISEKGAPSGVANLDADAKILLTQLPDLSAIYAKREVVQLADYLDPARVEGTTNDAPALASALAALPAEGGRLVWAPANIRIATAVNFNKPVLVMGAHPMRSKLSITGSKLVSISASNVTFSEIGFFGVGLPPGAILFDSDKSDASNHENWRFENCIFDSCGIVRFSRIGSLQADGTVLARGTDLAKNLSLVGCEAKGIRAAYGVEVNGVEGVVVERCHIHNNGIDSACGEGLKIMGSATNVRIALNNICNNSRDGLDMYDCLGGIVVGNDLHNNGVYGIEAKWASITAHPVDKFIVSNNRVQSNAGGGMNVDVPMSAITANQVNGNLGTGMRIGSAFDASTISTKYSTISANVVTSNTGNGIVVSNAGNGITIADNQAHNNGLSGIALGASTVGIIVSLNQCFGNGSRGISIEGGGHTVVGNRTQDPGNCYIGSGSSGHSFMQSAGSAQTGLFAPGYYYGPGGGRSTTTIAAGLLTFAPFWVGASTTFTRIGIEVTSSGGAGTRIRLGIYRDQGNGLPGSLVVDAGTLDAANTGAKELQILQTLGPGLYWLAALAEFGSPVVRTVSTVGLSPVGAGSLATATGATSQSGHYKQGVAAGGLPTPAGTFVGQTTAGPALVVLKAA